MNSVLLVDDDIKLTQLLKTYFEKNSFTVLIAHDGLQALQDIRQKKPDIVVLDLMLPQMDGWEICKRVRRESDVPIIMLTARDEEADRLIGLEIGADDYVTKPFSPREVVARAKVILRRTQHADCKPELLRVGKLELDTDGFVAKKQGHVVELTPMEFKILELLALNQGRVMSRLQIIEQVQGFAFEGYERTIDAHVKNLRRKIEDNPKEPKYIQTIYGVGYKLVSDFNE